MGAAVARSLAGRRRRLILADRNGAAAAAVADCLGNSVESTDCDIGDAAAVEDLVLRAGPVGALIVTAGLSPNMADGTKIVDVNLVATARLLTAFEPQLGPGSVGICFASMAAHSLPADPAVDALLDDPDSPLLFEKLDRLGLLSHSGLAYAISKRGVVRLVEHRAKAWGERGARLVSISPGVIDTPMGRLEADHEPAIAGMVRDSALSREGSPCEVAAVVEFLISDLASFITGTDVLVDGGAVAASRSIVERLESQRPPGGSGASSCQQGDH